MWKKKKDKMSEEIVISNKLDYSILGETITNEQHHRLDIMENFYKRLHDLNADYVEDSTSKVRRTTMMITFVSWRVK